MFRRLTTFAGLDFFAGTGALGFELASRGARHVTLIESNRQLVDQLSQTKRKLAADQVEIVAGDALSAAGRWPEASFEIIFIDPPFDSGLLAPALAAAVRLIAPDGLIYAESGAALERDAIAAASPANCPQRHVPDVCTLICCVLILHNRRPSLNRTTVSGRP